MVESPVIMVVDAENNLEKLLELPLAELIELADEVRAEHIGDRLEVCSIINAKSGLCGEDCRFCAQSSRHHAKVSVYPLVSKEKIMAAAQRACDVGAEKFGIVTSGNRLTEKEVSTVAESIWQIQEEIGISVCCSLGALEIKQLVRL